MFCRLLIISSDLLSGASKTLCVFASWISVLLLVSVVVVETAPRIPFSGVVTPTAPKETELEKTIREQVDWIDWITSPPTQYRLYGRRDRYWTCEHRYYRCDGCLLLSQRWFLIDEIVNIRIDLLKTSKL